MRCEVLAIGTELLLGQIVDTNSAWIGEQLAASGVESYEHRQVGDNLARMVAAIKDLVHGADALIVCGGLGPTPDDVTREAIAAVMGVDLERRDDLVEHIASLFGSRGRDMPDNNLRQADVPRGGDGPAQSDGHRARARVPRRRAAIVYAVPGVPYEMKEMVTAHVLPDLIRRSGGAATIRSRSLKTWGASESGLAEMIARAGRRAEQSHRSRSSRAASRASSCGSPRRLRPSPRRGRLLDAEEAALREILGELVFAVDDETMEHAVHRALLERQWTIAVGESLTGGLVGAPAVQPTGREQGVSRLDRVVRHRREALGARCHGRSGGE